MYEHQQSIVEATQRLRALQNLQAGLGLVLIGCAVLIGVLGLVDVAVSTKIMAISATAFFAVAFILAHLQTNKFRDRLTELYLAERR